MRDERSRRSAYPQADTAQGAIPAPAQRSQRRYLDRSCSSRTETIARFAAVATRSCSPLFTKFDGPLVVGSRTTKKQTADVTQPRQSNRAQVRETQVPRLPACFHSTALLSVQFLLRAVDSGLSGSSSPRTASGFKPRAIGQPVDSQVAPCPHLFDGSQDWVIACHARGRRFESGLRLQMPG